MTRNAVRRFPAGVSEKLGNYVYTLHDPREQISTTPFYIGKGSENDRCFDHFKEANYEENLSLKSRKSERILDIWKANLEVAIFIHRYGLTTGEALLVEAALIEAFPDALNEVEGHHSWRTGRIFLADLCSKLSPVPAALDFPAVIINIRNEWGWVKEVRGQSEEYEKRLFSATRCAWPVDIKKNSHVKYAVSVAQDVIRQVYAIDSWKVADQDSRGRPQPSGTRKMFEGKIAFEKSYLVGATIPPDMFRGGKQFPLRWVNTSYLNKVENENA
jgi:uncharacterized protein